MSRASRPARSTSRSSPMVMSGISKKPGEPAVRGNRQPGEGLPRATDQRRLIVSLDRRHPRPRGGRLYLKVRRGGRILGSSPRTSVAAIIAVGVKSEGRREVLGMQIGTSEAEPTWTEFLRQLTRRGLRGVKLVISDAHEGIKAAGSKVLCATWQRYRVHFMRNVPRSIASSCIRPTQSSGVVGKMPTTSVRRLISPLNPPGRRTPLEQRVGRPEVQIHDAGIRRPIGR